MVIAVLDHGLTSSLVLPLSDREFVRYAYGDWRYYALAERGLRSGISALCWPTTGTLGRRRVEGQIDPEQIGKRINVGFESHLLLRVEQASVARLIRQLDAQYEQEQSAEVWNPLNDLSFVPYPRSYSYWHNSNHELADWLRQLGCEVRGPALNSQWRSRI